MQKSVKRVYLKATAISKKRGPEVAKRQVHEDALQKLPRIFEIHEVYEDTNAPNDGESRR